MLHSVQDGVAFAPFNFAGISDVKYHHPGYLTIKVIPKNKYTSFGAALAKTIENKAAPAINL
ncbi:MAG: hypothetical protein LUQ26_01570 [Methylococcaceae bacterium]|nr:hypothetical protein [Methylococcaceae bacterium]